MKNKIYELEKLQILLEYKQELLNLNKWPVGREINGVNLADSLLIMNDINKLDLVKSNILD